MDSFVVMVKKNKAFNLCNFNGKKYCAIRNVTINTLL